jgi:hypothetical protein
LLPQQSRTSVVTTENSRRPSCRIGDDNMAACHLQKQNPRA